MMKKILFELLKAICTAVLTAAGVTIAGCTYPTYLN